MQTIRLYNSLTKEKEILSPLNSPFVGMYVCGPTVYGDAHLGHARPAVTFDVVYRYLLHLGYKVRYVRNITDVGHLENDADEGEDKIAKKARLEKLEPMEVVQHFTSRYHECMALLNVKSPNIEPRASGHIIEQIEAIKKIIASGYGYESNGSVYFDVKKYNEKNKYGKLSGRILDEMLANTRDTEGQHEKKFPLDFALWKKASPLHIMRWPSPWSEGFPGWHIECSVMGAKYLGMPFDIHGGGMDLLFPHHECEIAQSVASYGKEHVRYWMHNNMVTINGQKMGKSLDNAVTLEEFFRGSHPLLARAYSPMTIRFFILQAHYRSTSDFSNDALQAAEKGFLRLMNAVHTLEKITPSQKSSSEIASIEEKCYEAMNDDFNTPVAIANLFEGVRIINSVKDGKETISKDDVGILKKIFHVFIFDILGLKDETASDSSQVLDNVMQLVLSLRNEARVNKNFAVSDRIRDELQKTGVVIKDTKDGTTWEIEK